MIKVHYPIESTPFSLHSLRISDSCIKKIMFFRRKSFINILHDKLEREFRQELNKCWSMFVRSFVHPVQVCQRVVREYSENTHRAFRVLKSAIYNKILSCIKNIDHLLHSNVLVRRVHKTWAGIKWCLMCQFIWGFESHSAHCGPRDTDGLRLDTGWEWRPTHQVVQHQTNQH